MFDVFVESFWPEEDVGLFSQEKCGQLSSGLLHPRLPQELFISVLHGQAEREDGGREKGGELGVLRTLQQTSPEDGQVQAECQSVQSEVSDQRELQHRSSPLLQVGEKCQVFSLPSQNSVHQQLQLVMKV